LLTVAARPQVWEAATVNGTRRSYGRRWLDAARHPARRDGAILWALLMLPWVVALVLVRRHHHLDIGGWTLVLTASVGLPTLWVTWAAFRDTRRSGAAEGGPSLAQVADEVAAAVGKQWSQEAAVRRLNDPYPLSVSWAAAEQDLTDAWDLLVELTTSGAGWPSPAPGHPRAQGPDDLAGEGSELADVLDRVPTGRLVVLGEPGTGKTMLMVRLVLDLLARRAAGGPVPVLASVASWNPSRQDLRAWLSTRLMTDYPALAGPPPSGAAEPTWAAALLAAGLILPVMDGLDEIPDRVRGPAISRINDTLRPGEQVVVTCRTRQYRDAVQPTGGPEVTLRAAAAIQLRPLDTGAVRRYLRDDAPGPTARARWDPVLAVLGTLAPGGQALSTPLMVGLARAIYNPRPGELAGTMPDPAELCNFADRAAVEAHLFDQFIPAAYRSFTEARWTAPQAQTWLMFLARHLEQRVGSPDLAWWQLQKAMPRTGLWFAACIVVGPVAGLAVWLSLGAGLAAGLGGGLLVGLSVGLGAKYAAGLAAEADPDLPVRGMRISAAGLGVGLGVGLWTGLAAGLGVVLGGGGPGAGLGIGVGLGLATGLAGGLTGGVEGVPPDLTEAINPRVILARDRQMAFFFTLGLGIGGGLVAGLGVGLAGGGLLVGLVVGLGFGLGAGLVAGFVADLIGGTGRTKWTSYIVTRGWLAIRHRLPWSLMDFLADAHQRGVLRQAGAVYQFRHIDLQHRLATRRRQ
jgi:NACHT domain